MRLFGALDGCRGCPCPSMCDACGASDFSQSCWKFLEKKMNQEQFPPCDFLPHSYQQRLLEGGEGMKVTLCLLYDVMRYKQGKCTKWNYDKGDPLPNVSISDLATFLLSKEVLSVQF